MRKLVFLLSLLFPLSVLSVNISVRIYSADNLKAIFLAPKTGQYLLMGDGKSIDSITPTSVYEITVVDTLLDIKVLGRDLGKYKVIRLKEYSPDCSFNIQSNAEKNQRLYNDELLISCSSGYLKMLNIVDFEHYIAGVVQCETGQRRPQEFYKAQAIICRTYSLTNLARHLGEDYELCDAVHCQAYKGSATSQKIVQAVADTKDLVIVDSVKHIISASYYSNCGGYTLNSEDVWNKALPYLRAVKDTFCLNQPHAKWEKHFSMTEWSSYFEKKEATLTKTDIRGAAHWDSIPEEKRIYFHDKGYLIPLKDIRLDLNLHSTFFRVDTVANDVILKGRGNGHRVGFCQEGAMSMAQHGYNYSQILHFYYQNIQIIDSSFTSIPQGTK